RIQIQLQDESLNCERDAIFVIGSCDMQTLPLAQCRFGISHHDSGAGISQHLQVVEVIADRHDFFGRDPKLGCGCSHTNSLGCSRIEHINQGKVQLRIQCTDDLRASAKLAVQLCL